MQINVVGESRQRLTNLRRGTNLQRRTEMEFADLDVMLLEERDGILRFFKFDGQMAGVVIDAEMFIEARVVAMLGPQAVEELNGLAAGFQQAERFRLQTQMQFPSGLLADPRDVFDALPEIVPNHFQLLGNGDKPFERRGHGADAALNTRRHQLREQIKQQICVIQSFRRRPVRLIDLFLDARAVKPAKGKTVDRKNVAMVLVEPFLERQQRGAVAQLMRCLIAQPQADGIRLVGTNPLPHRQRMGLERVKCFLPRLAAMNVGAIGEMQAEMNFLQVFG